jgi:ABC-type multidrug transport system fused ATPase/permease subunit
MKSAIQYIKEILHLLGDDQSKLPRLVLLFISSSIIELFGIGLIVPYLTMLANPKLIETGTIGKIVDAFGMSGSANRFFIVFGVVLLLVFLLKSISAIFINKTTLSFVENQQTKLRSVMMESFQRLPYTEYISRNSSEYIQIITNLVSTYSSSVLLSALRLLSEGIVVFVILFLLAWTNGLILGLFAVLLAGMLYIYDFFFRVRVRTYGQKASEGARQMVQGIQEGIEGFKEVRILGAEGFFHNTMKQGANQLAHFLLKAQIVTSSPRYLMEFVIVLFIVLLVISSLVFGGTIQTLLPTLGLFGVASLRLMPSINLLSNSITQMRFGRHATSKVYAEMEKLQAVLMGSEESVVINSKFELFEELLLRNISFHYPGSEHNALSQVSITLKAGESIGLIGPSGSGKTTLVDVFLGLLQPQEGEILYNGHSLETKIRDWRSQIAYLPQNVFLIDNTLRRNVALGVQDEFISDDEVLAALQKAQLENLVRQLPNGIDTVLGERGVRISGGQRQRIALARAFYHGRSVLVMDESTSALDNDTEKLIVEEIKRLKGEKTMIVIAHRLTTLQHCDRIYMLTGGGILKETVVKC